jgi:hypothetical protein
LKFNAILFFLYQDLEPCLSLLHSCTHSLFLTRPRHAMYSTLPCPSPPHAAVHRRIPFSWLDSTHMFHIASYVRTRPTSATVSSLLLANVPCNRLCTSDRFRLVASRLYRRGRGQLCVLMLAWDVFARRHRSLPPLPAPMPRSSMHIHDLNLPHRPCTCIVEIVRIYSPTSMSSSCARVILSQSPYHSCSISLVFPINHTFLPKNLLPLFVFFSCIGGCSSLLVDDEPELEPDHARAF